jgi:division protein CdvB (Snf7/Vps24/ESCRT-III family)
MDFLHSYRLNHLVTDSDLAAQLKKKDYKLRCEIKILTDQLDANKKRLDSLLKRRKKKIEREGVTKPDPDYDYPITEFH